MSRLTWQRVAATLLVATVATMTPRSTAHAQHWHTKGGTLLRQSMTSDMAGITQVMEAWTQSIDLGPSATQPIVVGNYLYHVAGAHLWRIGLSETGAITEGPVALANGRIPSALEVNAYETGLPLVSQTHPQLQ